MKLKLGCREFELVKRVSGFRAAIKLAEEGLADDPTLMEQDEALHLMERQLRLLGELQGADKAVEYVLENPSCTLEDAAKLLLWLTGGDPQSAEGN